ncbi:MAG TPA: hypothetical protein VK712_02490 [Verrucomicrobiae bacterium]|jgi:hypothetical protein|nr:hypothetical protein [Verrucomicrobiae bacterium]
MFQVETPLLDSKVTCYDVLGELDSVMRSQLNPGREYYVLGGIATGALVHAETVIDVESGTVVAAQDSGSSLVRPNGTRRDIDILVGDILSRAEAERIKDEVAGAVDDKLKVSISSFDGHSEQLAASRLAQTIKAWTSKRTVDTEGRLRYDLFPLQRVVEPESYEPWQLELPNHSQVQMFHPAGHALAYSFRSISGIRHKDAEKYAVMQARVTELFSDEIHDGCFCGWADFAGDIQTVLNYGALCMPEVATYRDARPLDLDAFRLKGLGLAFFESQEKIVELAQGPGQGILDRIIGAV